jgi:hypothetical protein
MVRPRRESRLPFRDCVEPCGSKQHHGEQDAEAHKHVTQFCPRGLPYAAPVYKDYIYRLGLVAVEVVEGGHRSLCKGQLGLVVKQFHLLHLVAFCFAARV